MTTKAVFGRNKKGAKSSFQKKLGGEDFLTKKRGKDFFQKKIRGKDFFQKKIRGKDFFQANFAKTRPLKFGVKNSVFIVKFSATRSIM